MEMRCSQCGAPPGCGCGARYIPARMYAATALAEYPEKSSRLLAREVGISHMTIERMREPTVTNVTVSRRIGADGKVRNLPKKSEVCTQETCEPIYSKDQSVNKALLAVYHMLVHEGWTDYQLSLFIEAVKRLHTVAKGSEEWYEATQKRKQEKRNRMSRRNSSSKEKQLNTTL